MSDDTISLLLAVKAVDQGVAGVMNNIGTSISAWAAKARDGAAASAQMEASSVKASTAMEAAAAKAAIAQDNVRIATEALAAAQTKQAAVSTGSAEEQAAASSLVARRQGELTLATQGSAAASETAAAATAATATEAEASAGSHKLLGAAVLVSAAAFTFLATKTVDAAKDYAQQTVQLSNTAGISQSAAKTISDSFLQTAGTTTFSAQQMMTAYTPLSGQLGEMAGHALDNKQAMEFMSAAMDLSEASGKDLNTTTQNLANTMKLFHVGIQDSAAAADDLYNTSRLSGIGMDSLTSTINRLAPSLAGTNVSMQQASGLILEMTDKFGNGRKAITMVGTAMQSMTEPTAAASKAMAAAGLTFKDAQGNFIGLGPAFDELNKYLNSNASASDKAATMQAIYGKNAIDMTAIVKGGSTALAQYTQKVTDSSTAHKGAEQAASTLEGEQKKLAAIWDDLKVVLGQALIPLLTQFAKVILAILQPIVSWISQHEALTASILKVVAVVTIIIGTMLTLAKTIEIVQAALLILAANPIVLAIVAIIAVVYLLITHWQQVKEIVGAVWEWMKTKAQEVGDFLNNVWTSVANFFVDIWNSIVNFIKSVWNTIYSAVSTAVTSVSSFLQSTWNSILEFTKAAWNSVFTFIKGIWDSIYGAVSTAITSVSSFLQSAWNSIYSFIQSIWNGIYSFISGVLNSISSFIGSTWNSILNTAQSIWNTITGFLSGTWNTIKGDASTFFTGIENVISGVWDSIKSGAATAWNDIVNAVSSAWSKIEGVVEAPINVVIGFIDGFIDGANKILSVVGLPNIPDIPKLGGGGGGSSSFLAPSQYAAGGTLPGYAPGRDSILAMLSPGEGILTPQTVRAIGGPAGVDALNKIPGFASGGVIPGFAAGGIADFSLPIPIPNPINIVKGVVNDVKSAAGDVLGTLKAAVLAPGKWIRGALGSAAEAALTPLRAGLSALPSSPEIPSGMARSGALTVFDDVMKWIKGTDQAKGVDIPNAPGTTAQIAAWVAQAIALTGVPVTWAPGIETIISYESGGNPSAINLTDSNAAAGTPSQGLMQTIPATFNAYHQAGTSGVITDPIANIAAGINYIRARYGDISNVPGIRSLASGGSYVGYENGTLDTGPLAHMAMVHPREMVIPASIASQVRNGGGIGNTIHNHISGNYILSDRDIDVLVERIEKRFVQQVVPGAGVQVRM